MPAVFFFPTPAKSRDRTMRRDAQPLTPAELIKIRKLLKKPILEDVLSPRQVAAKLGFKDKQVVLALVAAGEFPNAFRPSFNRLSIPASDVAAYQEKHRVRTPALDQAT